MLNFFSKLNVFLNPVIPIWLIITIAIMCMGILACSIIYKSYKGTLWRLGACVALFVWLLSPTILQYKKESLPQTLLIVMDQSASMNIGNRLPIVNKTLDHIQKHLPHNIKTKVITVKNDNKQGTLIFHTIHDAVNEIPNNQLGGIIILSDGQIHDVPQQLPHNVIINTNQAIPIYTLLPSDHEETDRVLKILHAPSYNVVGKNAEIQLQVNDLHDHTNKTALLTIFTERQKPRTQEVEVGKAKTIPIPVQHSGKNIIGFSVSSLPHEISQANNNKIIQINGIRNKLKVLLVSSAPTQGERAWRSLLKSDPGVDLVHFTILRSAEQYDSASPTELALVPFPINELFMKKINNFDLIILDNFENKDTLPPFYLEQIKTFVQNGGGLLLTAGPELAGSFSLQNSPLASILPAQVHSTEDVINNPVHPEFTPLGQIHPITQKLTEDQKEWGNWYRFLKAEQINGNVLLQSPDHSPLLIIDHVQQGRIALLLSDQIWLWSKAGSHSGPQTELLKRLTYWLMKEPELEEQQLSTFIHNHQLTIELTDVIHNKTQNFIVTSPSGHTENVQLTPKDGTANLSLPAKEDGIWQVSNDHFISYSTEQVADPIENDDLAITSDKLQHLISEKKLFVRWLGKDVNSLHIPQIRVVNTTNNTQDEKFIDFPQHTSYTMTQQSVHHVFPAWLAFIFGIGCLLYAWYKESVI